MSDAASLISAISSISITLLNLLSTLSQFVDEVVPQGQAQAPLEVQRLSNILSSLYSCLGETKNSLHRASSVVLDESDLDEKVQGVLADCEECLGLLEGIVEKAKRREVKYVGATKWARVKFTFVEGQVKVLADRLEYYCYILRFTCRVIAENDSRVRTTGIARVGEMTEVLKSNRSKLKVALRGLEEGQENIAVIEYRYVGTSSRPPSYRPSASGPSGSSTSSSPRPKSPVDSAMVPYQLTREERSAMADARSIRWELQQMRFECPTSPSRNRYLHYEGRKAGLTVRIDSGPPLTCVVRKVTEGYKVETYNYLVTFSTVTMNPQTYTVSTTSRPLSSKIQSKSEDAEAVQDPEGYPGTETFTFDSRRDAQEFYQCLKVLIPLHRRCWDRAVVSLAPLTKELKISSSEEAEEAARRLAVMVDLRGNAEEKERWRQSLDGRGSVEMAFRGRG